MTAAIILFIWFLLIELVGGTLTVYAYVKDPTIDIPLPVWSVFVFLLPIAIAACAEVIW